MLGKSPIKWRQRPDMTIAVDWDVKHQFKLIQTKSLVLLAVQSCVTRKDVDLPINVFDWTVYLIQSQCSI